MKTILFATAAAVCAMTTAASATTLVVSNGLSPTHAISVHAFEPWMACVKEATGGGLDFNYFPSGQIASVSGSLDALSSGLAQVAFVSPSNESSKMPLSGIALLPGLGVTSTEMTKLMRDVWLAPGPIADELAANGVHPLILNSLPAYQIMSAGSRIGKVADFPGRKIRATGGAMTFTVGHLGATPVEMPAGDLYVAMQRGTVDGTIFSFSSAKTYSLQELLKSMSANGGFGTSAQMIAISNDAWAGLNPDEQRTLTDCGTRVEGELSAFLDEENAQLKEEFAATGVEVYDFTPEDKAEIDGKLSEVAADYIKQLDDRGLPGQQTYDQYLAAKGQ